MRLILFTNHYPYEGEPFLCDEIKIAEKEFEKILIISMERDTTKKRDYLPSNAQVISVREKNSSFLKLMMLMPKILSRRVWREVVYAKSTTNYSLLNIFMRILIDESQIDYLKKAEKKWRTFAAYSGATVLYSYWLDGAATYLARIESDFICVSRTHGGDCFFNRGYHPFRREQLSKLDLVFSVSEAGYKDLLEHYRKAIYKDNICVSKLGIRISEEQKNPWKNKKEKKIVSCSNVIRLKRLDLLIGALSKIKNIQIEWIHFGDGSEMDYITGLAQEKLEKASNISYHFAGKVDNQIIIDYYSTYSVDLFVNCSESEGIPVSMMEAMSFGIPCIGRNVGGISELIDVTCGLLPSKVSEDELSRAIETILKIDENEYYALREHSKERVMSAYSAENNYQILYKKIKRMNLEKMT